MIEANKPALEWSKWMSNPWLYYQAANDYFVDACQRAILYADIERQVGDQYKKQTQLDAPNVLNFPYELVVEGNTLAKPVNYALFRILPDENQTTDYTKRPFIIVDPRAGHGPGIGGFKPESEIGAALQAGHPCYFVGFLPKPVPGQTIEDVMRAHAEFVRVVASLHPENSDKPVVIGNCQAGWHVLMAAAAWPDLFGPIIVAGAPVSYWAGDNPMRYTGGVLGGSWMTAMASDLGNGLFDGASLVQNFENLDPANTLWTKKYNVFANVDTEASRYIGFEKYWGGYVYLNDVEMQYIVDNLFIGNKLSTAQLITSDGIRIDLRNIKSTILVFCSYGDNITPPAQALGWITDLYGNEDEIRSHDQTIVYSTHDSIGHLGIFVSGKVGRKEHRKFVNVIEQLDLLPAGIYRASVDKTPADNKLIDDPYLLSIHKSSIQEVRDIVQPSLESDRRFAAAAQLSEINLTLYRGLVQPWVRTFSTPQTAKLLRALHPMRLEFESWSSDNPLASLTGMLAAYVKQNRHKADADNPFLQLQELYSQAIENSLNSYRDARDSMLANWFNAFYSSPAMRALISYVPGDNEPVRRHPGNSPEHLAFVRERMQRIEEKLNQGNLIDAAIRALLFVFSHYPSVDERYHHAAILMQEQAGFKKLDDDLMRKVIREQALVLFYHGRQSIDAIPNLLLNEDPENIRLTAKALNQLVNVGDKSSPEVQDALNYVETIFQNSLSQKPTKSDKK